MFKIVLTFLLVMLIMSMAASAIARFFRGDPPPRVDKSLPRAKCAHCGRPVVGTAPCVCGKG